VRRRSQQHRSRPSHQHRKDPLHHRTQPLRRRARSIREPYAASPERLHQRVHSRMRPGYAGGPSTLRPISHGRDAGAAPSRHNGQAMTRPSKPTDRTLSRQMPPVDQKRKGRRDCDGDPLLRCRSEARQRAVGSVSGEHVVRQRSAGSR